MNRDLGQVFTPKEISNKMVELFNIDNNAKILDPCFGQGIFLNSLLEHGYNNLFGIEIDKKLYDNVKCEDCNLKNINFLDMNYKNEFDGIIINPPYIRQEEINNLKEYGIDKTYLKEKFKDYNISSRSNIYYYFLLKSIECLKENGEMVAIIPKTWNQTKIGKDIEKRILEQVKIEQIISLKPNIFGEGTLVDADIIKFKKYTDKNNLSNLNNNLDSNHVYLSTLAKTRRGLTSGDNKFFIFDKDRLPFEKKYFTKIISSPKQIKGFETASNVNYDYILDVKENYNEFNNELKKYIESSSKEHKKDNWFRIKKFNCFGIVFGYIIRDNIKFVFNNESYLVRDNFYITYNFDGSYYLLLGLLNNYYVFNYLESIGKNYGNGILKLQKYDMDSIPVINPDIISEKDKEKIIEQTKKNSIESIEKVSKILEKYEKISLEKIKENYMNAINKRKKGDKNND